MANCVRGGIQYRRHNFNEKGMCKGCKSQKVIRIRVEQSRSTRRKKRDV